MSMNVWYEQEWSTTSHMPSIEAEAQNRCKDFFGTLEGVHIYLDVEPILIGKSLPLRVKLRAERSTNDAST